jgi:hypothetical protein
MKRILAGLLTAIIMGVITWIGHGRPSAPGPSPTGFGPDSGFQGSNFSKNASLKGATACIEALLEAAKAGDVVAYLNAFGGPSHARLAREADEIGREDFALRLRRAGLARKGHAIFAPEPDGDRLDAAMITVESTFADRIERQTFRLEQTNSGWLVTEIETAREHVPKNQLGSLAKYEEPEAAPVAADYREPVNDEIEN